MIENEQTHGNVWLGTREPNSGEGSVTINGGQDGRVFFDHAYFVKETARYPGNGPPMSVTLVNPWGRHPEKIMRSKRTQ